MKLIPVSGQANKYDMTMADEPSSVGTPLNKNTFLKDSTASKIAEFAGNTPSLVDEALKALADHAEGNRRVTLCDYTITTNPASGWYSIPLLDNLANYSRFKLIGHGLQRIAGGGNRRMFLYSRNNTASPRLGAVDIPNSSVTTQYVTVSEADIVNNAANSCSIAVTISGNGSTTTTAGVGFLTYTERLQGTLLYYNVDSTLASELAAGTRIILYGYKE